MPLYICNSRAGTIPEPARAEIAADITRIHCEGTGAPPQFVHAFFLEDAPGPSIAEHRAVVAGSIRGGRTHEQKQAIVDQVGESLQRHAGLTAADVFVATSDVPASWAMEGGEVMPEPGEEAAWLAAHSS